MSFSFRDKSNLRDRLRGKSGDEIMEELKQSMDQDRKSFFESHPKWRKTPATSAFSRGFPFEDGLAAGGSKSKLKTHLEDLATRHPEIADSLRDWIKEENREEDKDLHRPPEGGQRGEEKKEPWKESQEQGGCDRSVPSSGGLEGGESKLRNTVPDMQQQTNEENRGQRSQSAPPQTPYGADGVPPQHPLHPPKNEEGGVRMIPIRTDSPSRPAQQQYLPPQSQPQQPPSHHHQANHQQPPQPHQGPTVRHIPIFVEGRDEPILPRDIHQTGVTPNIHVPPPNRRGGGGGQQEGVAQSTKRAPPPPAQPQQAPPRRQQEQPQHEAPSPTPAPQSQPQQQTSPQPQPAPQPQQTVRPDSLVQVAEVVKDVERLRLRVDEWKGKSRAEKEYIYLDEMLTRNLLKLDIIETEGREEVRSARKEAIRRITEAISTLESKSVTSVSSTSSGGKAEVEPMDTEPPAAQSEPMVVNEEPPSIAKDGEDERMDGLQQPSSAS